MAIVFVSPKKRQRIFLFAAGTATLFLIIITAVILFLPQLGNILKNVSPDAIVVNEPKIEINFRIMDSESTAKLESFGGTGPRNFFYLADDKSKGRTSGTVSADSVLSAIKTLEKSGFENITITELEIGKNNPFAPY